MATATAFSMAANVLTGYATAAMTAGGPDLVRFLRVQDELSWPGDGPPITRSPAAPTSGETDDLHIQGDCDALYVNSGEFDREWRPAERRSVVIVASFERDFGPVRTRLFNLGDDGERWIRLDTRSDRHARVVIVDEESTWPGPWFEVPPQGEVRVGVGVQPEFGYAEVSSLPGGFVGFVRAFSLDDDGIAQPDDPEPDYVNTAQMADRGISLRSEPGIEPPLCRSLAARAAARAGQG
jgi:hypothetical protein